MPLSGVVQAAGGAVRPVAGSEDIKLTYPKELVRLVRLTPNLLPRSGLDVHVLTDRLRWCSSTLASVDDRSEVAFESFASNLVPNDTNGSPNVFLGNKAGLNQPPRLAPYGQGIGRSLGHTPISSGSGWPDQQTWHAAPCLGGSADS